MDWKQVQKIVNYHLTGHQTIKVSAKVVANLPAKQTEEGAAIAKRQGYEQPYWSIERARIGTTQKAGVELLVNGESVDTVK